MRKNRMSTAFPVLSIKDLRGSEQRAYVWVPIYIAELTKAAKSAASTYFPKSVLRSLKMSDEDLKRPTLVKKKKGKLQSLKDVALKYAAPVIPFVLLERFEGESQSQIATSAANNVLEGPVIWAFEKIISTFIQV